MIRIINQEEFKKCCEMCNSRDIESRYLGLSLLEECIEYFNWENLIVKIVHINGMVDLYEWSKFIEIGINVQYYKFGNDLFDLIFQGYCNKSPDGFKMVLIEDDQSN